MARVAEGRAEWPFGCKRAMLRAFRTTSCKMGEKQSVAPSATGGRKLCHIALLSERIQRMIFQTAGYHINAGPVFASFAGDALLMRFHQGQGDEQLAMKMHTLVADAFWPARFGTISSQEKSNMKTGRTRELHLVGDFSV